MNRNINNRPFELSGKTTECLSLLRGDPRICKNTHYKLLFFIGLCLSFLFISHDARAAKCLYVSSYHQGYEWNDGIERGLLSVLDGRCNIDKFYLDTKRNTSSTFAEQMALKAKQHIEISHPDIIIAGDDNASRYLIKPYFKDADIPVVFCGINWTVEEYGYPYSNATGMIEVVSIIPLLKVIQTAAKPPLKGIYLSSDVFTEHKDFERYRSKFAQKKVSLEGVFVKTLDDWKQQYQHAQSASFIILGNNGGINNWNREAAASHALQHANIFTVTNYDWMMPYAMFAMTKIPEEQGQWAAEVALAILDGMKPVNIPIVVNRRWNIFVNMALLTKANIQLGSHLLNKAVKVGE